MSNGPPSGNPTPLEKTLMHMDLSKGVNERDRPETGNPMTMMTRVENLVQDQGGAYIKRPGNAALGGLDTGTSFTPAKMLRLREGLGMVDDAFNFYQYQESTSKFRGRGQLPEFSVSADMVASSGASVSPSIFSSGSCTLFHFVIHSAGLVVGATNSTLYLSIYDRQSGSVVGQYDLSIACGGANVSSAMACFVDDRYLHVYVTAAGVAKLFFIFDTTLPLPTTAANVGTGALVATAFGSISGTAKDCEPGVGRSYFVSDNGSYTVYSMNNAGTLVTGPTVVNAAHGPVCISFSGTKLWVMNDTNIGALDSSTLAASVAMAAHGGPATAFTMCADRTDRVWCAYETTTTFGATTLASVSFKKTSAGGTTLSAVTASVDGWRIGSSPFEALVSSSTYGVYVQLYKDSTLSPVPTCVVPMDATKKGSPTSLDAGFVARSYDSLRVACTIEPFLAVRNNNSVVPFLKTVASVRSTANEFSFAVPMLVQARGFGYSMASIRPSVAQVACQAFAGVNYISGGAQCMYGGGEQPVEVGFVDVPAVSVQAGAAGMPNGSYKYILQYRYTDETGAVTWSRTSPVASISLASLLGTVTMTAPNVTCKDKRLGSTPSAPLCSVELYRTKAGGTQYYLCASSAAKTPSSGTSTQVAKISASKFYTVTDNMSDTVLASQPTMFRQPGTPNSGLDRYPPPSGNILCQHKDRLFTVDTYGARVCYSSFFVDGETAWFNPAFSFFVHGGSGRITGMVSMDGRLFIFKRDAIFVVDGDGPSEGGVVGNEFSPPQRLATEYGCVDHRSLVVMSDGIMYRSARGIEMLTRGLKVNWIGDRVFNTVNNYPATLGAVLDTSGRVHFCLAASEAATPLLQEQIAGVEIVYDTPTDSWTSYYGDPGSGYGKCAKSTAMANLYGLGEVQVYANVGKCSYSNESVCLDVYGAYVPWVVETGWIRTGQQTRQRISDAFLLAKKTDNHAIRISAAYDYVDAYTQTFTWQPDVINALSIEQLCLQLIKPQCLAVRFLVEEIAATDQVTYPCGNGRGTAFLGLTFQVAPMNGAPTVSAAAQGYVGPAAPPANITTELDVALETELSVTITLES